MKRISFIFVLLTFGMVGFVQAGNSAWSNVYGRESNLGWLSNYSLSMYYVQLSKYYQVKDSARIDNSAQSGKSIQTGNSDSRKFLNRYSKLIGRVKAEYYNNEDSVYAWKSERKKIKNLYSQRYKYLFTDDEMDEYYELNAKYMTKSKDIRFGKFEEKLDTVGSEVSRTLNRTGRKVSGFLKGLKKQSDENRRRRMQ